MEGIDLGFVQEYLPRFLHIFLRTSLFMVFMPFFGNKSYPATFKLGFAVVFALVLTPVIDFHAAQVSIPVMVFRECILGMALGFSVRLVFEAVNVAGQIIATAMGLRVGQVYDPEFGQTGELSRLLGAIATLQFLAMNGHHDLIYVFVNGYEIIPAGGADVNAIVKEMIPIGGRILMLGLKISMPMIVGMMLVHVVIGLLNKAAPKMNITMVSYSIYIVVGIVILYLSVPVFINLMEGEFPGMRGEMMKVFSAAKG